MFHGMKGQASKLCAYLCGGINLSDHLNFLHLNEASKTVHPFFGGRLNQFKKIYRMKGQASRRGRGSPTSGSSARVLRISADPAECPRDGFLERKL